MIKILNIVGILLLVGSSTTLAMNKSPFNAQAEINFKSNSQQTTYYSGIVDYVDTSYHLQFAVTLGDSTYNGFPGWINQIVVDKTYKGKNNAYAIFFFQYLNDNEFGSAPSRNFTFPDLNSYTAHGFWHWPLSSDNRLEEYMGHFGPWSYTYEDTVYSMIWDISNGFMQGAESAYQNAQNPTGIRFNFNFGFQSHDAGFVATFPDYGHSYTVLY